MILQALYYLLLLLLLSIIIYYYCYLLLLLLIITIAVVLHISYNKWNLSKIFEFFKYILVAFNLSRSIYRREMCLFLSNKTL